MPNPIDQILRRRDAQARQAPVQAEQAAQSGYQNPGAMVMPGFGELPPLRSAGQVSPGQLRRQPGSDPTSRQINYASGRSDADLLLEQAMEDFRQRNIGRITDAYAAPQIDAYNRVSSDPQARAKAEMTVADQFGKLQGMGREAEKTALDRILGLGNLGVQQGRLGLDRQKAQTERDLGTGQLQIGQRAQQWQEQKIAHDINEDKTGNRFIQAILAHPTMSEAQKGDAINRYYRERTGDANPSPVPGKPFPPMPSQQGLPASPPGPGLLPDVPQQAQAGQNQNNLPQRQRGELGKWEQAFTPEIAAELKGAKNIQEAAQILDRRVASQGITKEQGQHMMQYLKETYGDRAFRDYAQGSLLGNAGEFIGTGLGSLFGAGQPSANSEVASKYRNLAGLPAKGIPRWYPGAVAGPAGWIGAGAGYLGRALGLGQ